LLRRARRRAIVDAGPEKENALSFRDCRRDFGQFVHRSTGIGLKPEDDAIT
jgi:hypothetical protein